MTSISAGASSAPLGADGRDTGAGSALEGGRVRHGRRVDRSLPLTYGSLHRSIDLPVQLSLRHSNRLQISPSRSVETTPSTSHASLAERGDPKSVAAGDVNDLAVARAAASNELPEVFHSQSSSVQQQRLALIPVEREVGELVLAVRVVSPDFRVVLELRQCRPARSAFDPDYDLSWRRPNLRGRAKRHAGPQAYTGLGGPQAYTGLGDPGREPARAIGDGARDALWRA